MPEVTLPNSKTILACLDTVTGPETLGDIYFSIAINAGLVVTPENLISIFFDAVEYYCIQHQTLPITKFHILNLIPAWIDALIDDFETATAAKALYESKQVKS